MILMTMNKIVATTLMTMNKIVATTFMTMNKIVATTLMTMNKIVATILRTMNLNKLRRCYQDLVLFQTENCDLPCQNTHLSLCQSGIRPILL